MKDRIAQILAGLYLFLVGFAVGLVITFFIGLYTGMHRDSLLCILTVFLIVCLQKLAYEAPVAASILKDEIKALRRRKK